MVILNLDTINWYTHIWKDLASKMEIVFMLAFKNKNSNIIDFLEKCAELYKIKDNSSLSISFLLSSCTFLWKLKLGFLSKISFSPFKIRASQHCPDTLFQEVLRSKGRQIPLKCTQCAAADSSFFSTSWASRGTSRRYGARLRACVSTRGVLRFKELWKSFLS